MSSRERKLQDQYSRLMKNTQDPVEKLSHACLARGYSGLLALGRLFRRQDKSKSHSLSKEEIINTIQDFGVQLTKEQTKELFEQFEPTSTGEIEYEDLLDLIRPPMSDPRKEVVALAFNSLDLSEDELVNIEDFKLKFNAAQHPSVKTGEQTEQQVFTRLMDRLEHNIGENGMMTMGEFFDYYTAVSKSMEDDDSFVNMIRQLASMIPVGVMDTTKELSKKSGGKT